MKPTQRKSKKNEIRKPEYLAMALLWSIPETALLLNSSASVLYKRHKELGLKLLKLGGRSFFSRKDVEQMVEVLRRSEVK